jgi:hypothetical protein
LKKVIILVCAVIVAFVAFPVFAAEQAGGKNDYLVYGMNGFNVRDSLPERISKLKTEITKGESVYTPEELKVLDRKLIEENVTMRSLTKPGK